MKYAIAPILALGIALSSAGCGGSGDDRVALAKQAVTTYWTDVDHGKLLQSYKMLTSGTRSVTAFSSYRSNMIGFLQSVAGVHVVASSPQVSDDRATVPVSLFSPKASGSLKAYQHLFWENGAWRISDQNGGVSSTR